MYLLWRYFVIIHPHIPKRKKRTPTAAQRQLAAEWDAIVKKYQPKKKIATNVTAWTGTKSYVRETPHYPSLNTGNVAATKASPKVYTGTKVMGIATMHKSNAVPVFNNEEAVEISKMRR
jgi:hypothetical protein